MKVLTSLSIFFTLLASVNAQGLSRQEQAEITVSLNEMMKSFQVKDYDAYWSHMHPEYLKLSRKSRRKIKKSLKIPLDTSLIKMREHDPRIVQNPELLSKLGDTSYALSVMILSHDIYTSDSIQFQRTIQFYEKNFMGAKVVSDVEKNMIQFESPAFLVSIRTDSSETPWLHLPFNINDITYAFKILPKEVYDNALARIDEYYKLNKTP